jgi:hypothetical protein
VILITLFTTIFLQEGILIDKNIEPQGQARIRCEKKLRNSENRFNVLDMERLRSLSYDPEVENAVTDFHTNTKDAYSLIRSVLPDLYIKDLEQVETRLQAMSPGLSRLEEIISNGNNLMADALKFHSDFVNFSKKISKISGSNINIGNSGVNATGHSTPDTKESMDKSNDEDPSEKMDDFIDEGSKYPIQQLIKKSSGKNFWWINADPKIWKVEECKVGSTQQYSTHNKEGRKRQVFDNFFKVKPGDLALMYESSPSTCIKALCEITKTASKQIRDTISFKILYFIQNQTKWSVLKKLSGFENSRVVKNPQGSLFDLSYSEFVAVVNTTEIGLIEDIDEPERVTQSAELLNDSAKGPMFVDITKEVEAFTYMMVAEDLKPPLSIGLFGKWGTGKSFFMHKMHDGIEELVHKKQISVTKADDNNPDKIDICEHVLQIQFNAWHYVDSNLWASLVNHIFEEISTYVGNKTPEERRENKLYTELETNKRLIEKTNNTLKSIKAEQESHQTILDNFQKEKVKVKASLQEVSLKDIYKNIRQDKDVEATLKKATEAISELGPINEQDNVGELQSLITRYSGTWQKIKNIYNEFKSTWRKVLMLFLIVFIFVIAFFPVFFTDITRDVIPVFGDKVGPWKSFFKTIIAQLVAIVIPLLGFLSQFMPKARVALDRLNSGVSYLEKARDKVKHLESIATRELDMKIRKMEYRLVDLKEQEANSLEEKKQIDLRVRKIETKLDDIKQGKQLAAFIERRSNSNDYKQHLGLVYLIQRDFKHLSDFLSKENNSLHPKKDKRIDRIILYIDDLDRCPPNKVLEVLEAVHLVLAFPLFVVVVGVDTRWIYKSLIKSRKLMLRATELNEKAKSGEDLVSGVSPYEYMEKIFQIPFRINPLNNEERKDLLTGVLSRDLVKDEREDIQTPPTSEQTKPVSKSAKAEYSQSKFLEAEEPVSGDESSFEEDEEKKEVLQKLEQTRRNLDRLKISREEYDFIHSLTPIIGGTPRTIKRFVNTFKLLKSNDGWFCFPETCRPAYKEILFMYAIVNGSPNFSILFYKALRKAAIGSKTLSQFINELKPMTEDKQAAEEQSLIKEFLKKSSSREVSEIKLCDLKTISHRVARFSFRLTDYALL